MKNNKDRVYLSYEKIADWYDEHRSRDLFEKPWLDQALSYAKANPTILDLGCGMGEPMIPYLIEKGCTVTGIDGSEKLITLAKQRIPQATFLVGDMRTTTLPTPFDLVIAWHSFFHLCPDDQRSMFKIFSKHTDEQSILLFTTGPEAGEIWGDNGGENLYHASLSCEEYKELLNQYGFQLLNHKIEDPECADATVWLAQKKALRQK